MVIKNGDLLHFTASGQVYNILVESVEYSSSRHLFEQLKVTLTDMHGTTFHNQHVYNLHLFGPVRQYTNVDVKHLETMRDFWETVEHTNVEMNRTPRNRKSVKTRSRRTISPLMETSNKFVTRGVSLFFTNKHGVEFEIKPQTMFVSTVTFDDTGRFSAKAPNLSQTYSTDSQDTGTIEGKFLKFNENSCSVLIQNLKKTISYDGDIEFWATLKIVTEAQRFPRNGKYEVKDKSTLMADDNDRVFTFQRGDKFSSTIFRPATWNAAAKGRVAFDFTLENGIKQLLYGKFVGFDGNDALLSIDFNKIEKSIMALGTIAGVAAAVAYGVGPEKVASAASAVYGQATAAYSRATAAYGQATAAAAAAYTQSMTFLQRVRQPTVAVPQDEDVVKRDVTKDHAIAEHVRKNLINTVRPAKDEMVPAEADEVENTDMEKLRKFHETIVTPATKFKDYGTILLEEFDKADQTENEFVNSESKRSGKTPEHIRYALRTAVAAASKAKNEGGGVFTYRVPIDPRLPFWKNLHLEKGLCSIAESKGRDDVDAVREAVDDEDEETGPKRTLSATLRATTLKATPRAKTLKITPRATTLNATISMTPPKRSGFATVAAGR
jgi:hypothetical protein